MACSRISCLRASAILQLIAGILVAATIIAPLLASDAVEAWRLEALAVSNPDARAQAPAVRQQRRQAIRPRGAAQRARFVERSIGSSGLETAWCRRCSEHQHIFSLAI